jgi:hypothetical protein
LLVLGLLNGGFVVLVEKSQYVIHEQTERSLYT